MAMIPNAQYVSNKIHIQDDSEIVYNDFII